jgi:hypothetical protein
MKYVNPIGMTMRLIGSIFILVIQFQHVSTLNHGAFLGGTTGQQEVTTSDDGQVFSGPFFDPSFFTPLPPPPAYPSVPVPVPITTTYPKPTPTQSPTDKYAVPTPYPIHTPVPTTAYIAPTHPPTKTPTTSYSTTKPTEAQPSSPTSVPIKILTRTATYTAQWGIDVGGCSYGDNHIFFYCHDGGLIKLVEASNAVCKNLSDDYLSCEQTDLAIDAYIEFTCTGIKSEHTMATASLGPSKATGCSNDGNAVKFVTLNRHCHGEDGKIYWEGQVLCDDGELWTRNGIDFCASPAVCTASSSPCVELEMGSVTIVNVNENLQCSVLEKDLDLQLYEFKTSALASLNLVDWRFSGQGRGCHWTPSSLMLRCEGGGTLEFLEDYPFCTIIPEDNIAICDSFAPFTTANEEAVGLLVSCSGKNEDQLVLAVEIPSEVLEVDCAPSGLVIQSVMLARACGDYETPEFEFVNDEGFCHDPEQLFVVDDLRSYCFVGDTCEFEEGCYQLQLPSVTANTGTSLVGDCTYAV